MKGKFITFEGIDGAGKSTQIAAAVARIEQAGIEVVLTREPGGTALSEKLRELVLHEAMHEATELQLMFAARTEHLMQKIGPALVRGAWVLSDRFTDATYAYQGGGRGISNEKISLWEQGMQDAVASHFGAPVQPNRTYLFDLSPEVAAQRVAAARKADRFEAQEREFFERVRRAYLARARTESERFVVLDAEQSKEQLTHQICINIDQLLSQHV